MDLLLQRYTLTLLPILYIESIQKATKIGMMSLFRNFHAIAFFQFCLVLKTIYIEFDKSYVQVFIDKVTCFLLCNALSKSLSPDSRINMFCHLKQVFYKIELKYCEIK